MVSFDVLYSAPILKSPFIPQIKTSVKSGATAINYVVTLSEVTSALVTKVMLSLIHI